MAINCVHGGVASARADRRVINDRGEVTAACQPSTHIPRPSVDRPLRAVWHLDPRSRRLEMRWSVVGTTQLLSAEHRHVSFPSRIVPLTAAQGAHGCAAQRDVRGLQSERVLP
jgi:hypothetical protein